MPSKAAKPGAELWHKRGNRARRLVSRGNDRDAEHEAGLHSLNVAAVMLPGPLQPLLAFRNGIVVKKHHGVFDRVVADLVSQVSQRREQRAEQDLQTAEGRAIDQI